MSELFDIAFPNGSPHLEGLIADIERLVAFGSRAERYKSLLVDGNPTAAKAFPRAAIFLDLASRDPHAARDLEMEVLLNMLKGKLKTVDAATPPEELRSVYFAGLPSFFIGATGFRVERSARHEVC